MSSQNESAQTREQTLDRTDETDRRVVERGNFYYNLGFALLAGLAGVVLLGFFGITSAGVFSVTTAMAMVGLAIGLLSVVSFVTLLTLRRTMHLLNVHATALADQAEVHADLADKVQTQWHVEQIERDRRQDQDLETISARQDASYFANEVDAQHTGTNGPASASASPDAETSEPFDPFRSGDAYLVREIEGIGEHYGRLLDQIGLKTTEQLWAADGTYVAGALHITPAAVRNWQRMAELMAVNGIGKQYAELLVRAGVSSIDDLAQRTSTPLLDRIHGMELRLTDANAGAIQGNTIGPQVVKSWIRAAREHPGYPRRGTGPTAADAVHPTRSEEGPSARGSPAADRPGA